MIIDFVIACDKREAFAQGSEATVAHSRGLVTRIDDTRGEGRYSITLFLNSASGTKHSSYFPKIR